jgi:hypothetical protein
MSQRKYLGEETQRRMLAFKNVEGMIQIQIQNCKFEKEDRCGEGVRKDPFYMRPTTDREHLTEKKLKKMKI